MHNCFLHTYNGLIALAVTLSFLACSNEEVQKDEATDDTYISLTSDVRPFEGLSLTRANLDGDAFLPGDLIKVKMICPFVSGTQLGETTYSNSVDGLYFMKASGTGTWEYVVENDGFDLNGDHYKSGSPKMSSYHQVQQTPYVFTAETWSEERSFVVNKSMRVQQTNVFHHDQHQLKHHLASDVLWSQTIMQTGGTNVHLSFEHKMACLDVTVSTEASILLSDATCLTLEKMPNIDQCEIIIGNYYADKDVFDTGYGYRQKYSCGYDYNGTVLGVNEIDEESGRSKLRLLPGCESQRHGGSNTVYSTRPVVCDGTYTAYKVNNKHFRLMVPPCKLTENAVFWLRDGEKRYSASLIWTEFKSGEMYPVTIKITDGGF